MKTKLLFTSLTMAAALCATSQAQVTTGTPRDNSPAAEPSSQLPPATLPAPPAAAPETDATPAPADTPPGPPAPPAPAATRVTPKVPPPPGAMPPVVAPAVEDVPANVPVATAEQDLIEEEGGWRINDASLNDIFQFLAKAGDRQYFHNMKIAGPEFRVTGHLNDGSPLQQMEDLAFMYGLTLYTKGDTVYALTEAQLNQLPSAEFHYQLHYLRPTDIDTIKDLIKPVLSPGTGIVNFEPKTNTIVIIDSAHHIEMARELLHSIDKAKGQIVVETKIMRINSGVSERIGVDWSSSLGETGTSIEVAKSLNSVFGLSSDFITALGNTSGESLGTIESSLATNSIVLSPVQLNGVLRALSEGGFASQISNPTLITEDNEQATISIIDRVPIITATVNQTQNANNITEEVRYKIDPEDPTMATDPEHQREIGISLVVTPTLLPDGTVRMRLRPRSAQIVDEVQGQSGNYYPRVTEAMIESITRVPDGFSLVIGGFYGEIKKENDNKVPILGDVPLLNFFFKSSETVKEQTSLVFIVTPTSYDPTSAASNNSLSNRVHSRASMPGDNMWVDPELNPGPAHEANMCRTIRGVKNQRAPYYPTAAEQENAARKASGYQPVRSTKPRFNSARRR
jgi:type II secretory pathway component GspD/PulD (secretin)